LFVYKKKTCELIQLPDVPVFADKICLTATSAGKMEFERLSDLVLADILAALPLQKALQVAQCGNGRLQRLAQLPWLLNRMSDVDFPTTLKAYRAGGWVREAFCCQTVLKRLYGRVHVYAHELVDGLNACFELLEKVPGRLLVYTHDLTLHEDYWDLLENSFFAGFPNNKREQVLYVVSTIHHTDHSVVSCFPNLVFFSHNWEYEIQFNLYRPPLLNGRHLLDVIRAIFEPADVDEPVMERVRREITESAEEWDHSDRAEAWDLSLPGVWVADWSDLFRD